MNIERSLGERVVRMTVRSSNTYPAIYDDAEYAVLSWLRDNGYAIIHIITEEKKEKK